MAQIIQPTTTFEPSKVIRPIFTRGNVALSRDGRILATCLDSDVVLSDLYTGREMGRIDGDDEMITSIALTPSASHIAVCSRSLTMRIYALVYSSGDDRLHPQLQRSLKPHLAPVVVSAIDDSGSLLATGGADSIINVWDIKGGFVTHSFQGHSGLVSALHFFQLPLEWCVADLEKPGKRNKKNVKNNDNSTVDDPANEGNLVAASYRLASGGEDGKIKIWSLHKRRAIATLDSHVSVVRSLKYCQTSHLLLSASRDRTLMIWDAKIWKNRHTIPVLEELDTAGFLANGAVAYTGGEKGPLRLWSVSNGKELTADQSSGTETEAILDSIYHENLDFLLTVHADQTILMHNLDTLDQQLKESTDQKIEPLPLRRRVCGNYDQIVDLAYLGPEKTLLAVNSNSEHLRVISLQRTSPGLKQRAETIFGSEVALLKGHDNIIISLAVDTSGCWIATGAKDNNARIWHLAPNSNQFSCHSVLTGHAGSVTAVAFAYNAPPTAQDGTNASPAQRSPIYLITGSEDKTIKRWNILPTSSRALFTRKAHEKDINAVATHASTQYFASASHDKLIKLWSAEDGNTIGVLRGHRRGVWSISFSPLGIQVEGLAQSPKQGYLLSGSGDNSIRVWSLSDYSCLLTLEGHANSILKVVWLPVFTDRASHDKRGVMVASAAADKLVKVWDLTKGECVTTLDGHTDRVWALASRPSDVPNTAADEALISGGADGVLTFWRDTSAETAQKEHEKEATRIETEQKLSNLMHGRDFQEAIPLALQLDQPGRLYALFRDVYEKREQGTWTGSKDVDRVVASLADEQIYRLLLRCRDWNTNAKTMVVAQRVLAAVLRSYSREKLASLRVPWSFQAKVSGSKGLKQRPQSVIELLEALEVWTDRHYRRTTDLWDESFFLDFVLGEMGEMGDDGIGWDLVPA